MEGGEGGIESVKRVVSHFIEKNWTKTSKKVPEIKCRDKLKNTQPLEEKIAKVARLLSQNLLSAIFSSRYFFFL